MAPGPGSLGAVGLTCLAAVLWHDSQHNFQDWRPAETQRLESLSRASLQEGVRVAGLDFGLGAHGGENRNETTRGKLRVESTADPQPDRSSDYPFTFTFTSTPIATSKATSTSTSTSTSTATATAMATATATATATFTSTPASIITSTEQQQKLEREQVLEGRLRSRAEELQKYLLAAAVAGLAGDVFFWSLLFIGIGCCVSKKRQRGQCTLHPALPPATSPQSSQTLPVIVDTTRELEVPAAPAQTRLSEALALQVEALRLFAFQEPERELEPLEASEVLETLVESESDSDADEIELEPAAPEVFYSPVVLAGAASDAEEVELEPAEAGSYWGSPFSVKAASQPEVFVVKDIARISGSKQVLRIPASFCQGASDSEGEDEELEPAEEVPQPREPAAHRLLTGVAPSEEPEEPSGAGTTQELLPRLHTTADVVGASA